MSKLLLCDHNKEETYLYESDYGDIEIIFSNNKFNRVKYNFDIPYDKKQWDVLQKINEEIENIQNIKLKEEKQWEKI